MGVDPCVPLPVIAFPTAAAKYETALQIRQEAFRDCDGSGYARVEDATEK